MPAIACTLLLSVITGVSVDKEYSSPSNAFIFSFFFAYLTQTFPSNLSLSNACIGCPTSSIT